MLASLLRTAHPKFAIRGLIRAAGNAVSWAFFFRGIMDLVDEGFSKLPISGNLGVTVNAYAPGVIDTCGVGPALHLTGTSESAHLTRITVSIGWRVRCRPT